ncbi:hypothetical protein RF11_00849 [Thelohanellus kitauei]|uniref:Uncharacterized protein n=1 Tax=Thelohanellus kitauei TaxID=669202 RepID=A0A0C2JLD6_THEKT|nr:hypothetical protein RF11_00849 [Thelohanellus kitauei]
MVYRVHLSRFLADRNRNMLKWFCRHESSEIKVRKTQDEIKVESPQASPRSTFSRNLDKLKSAMTLFSNPSVTRVRQDFVEYFLNPFFKYADTTYSDTSAEYLKTWTLNLINNYQISDTTGTSGTLIKIDDDEDMDVISIEGMVFLIDFIISRFSEISSQQASQISCDDSTNT